MAHADENAGHNKPPHSFHFQINDVVAGRYRVEAVIGRGGAGTVYRSSALGMDYTVALKVMHDADETGVDLRRFEREAKLAQRLRHKHAVQILDMGYLDDGRPYIVYELLQGRSLRQALRKEGPFDAARAARISYALLDALVFAHDAAIVHRDIKPANIFLAVTRDEAEVPKLLDLGLASAPEGEDGVPLTQTGYRLGTPRYMSPEMARGQRVGPESDLYSLALVMAEMITAKPVLSSKMQIELLMAHASEEALRLSYDILDTPLYPVIERALSKDLSVRYRTALQMRADVEAVIGKLEGHDDDDDPLTTSADLAPTMMMNVAELVAQGKVASWAPASSKEVDSLPVRSTVGILPPPGSQPPAAVSDSGVPDSLLVAHASLPGSSYLPNVDAGIDPVISSAPPDSLETATLPAPAFEDGPPSDAPPSSAAPSDAPPSGASPSDAPPSSVPTSKVTTSLGPVASSPISRKANPPLWLMIVALLLLAAAAGAVGYSLGG